MLSGYDPEPVREQDSQLLGRLPPVLLEKSEYAVTSNELKNQFDIPIQLFLSCIGYQ